MAMFLALVSVSCNDSTKEKAPTVTENNQNKLNYVDPFLGTGGHGHTYPGAILPFGMVQLSPDNGTEGWDWSSGYHYSDSAIAGFSHLHLSGTGIGDYADISFMPKYEFALKDSTRAAFEHKNETATPGYYSVKLKNGIQVELTTSKRVGLHRYTFPKDSLKNVVIDLGFAINWDKPVDTRITIKNDTLITGYRKSTGWAKQQWVYFAAVFSQPIKKYELFGTEKNSKQITDSTAKGSFTFSASAEPLLIKVGISSASADGALQNILDEAKTSNFDEVVTMAEKAWQQELQKISATLIEPEMDTIFYSALYHAFLSPNLFSDTDGQYKSVGHMVTTAQDYDRYTVFSLWDTFRAVHPLFTLLQPEKNQDFIQSMMAFYNESGLLPVWALAGNETNTMTGYHAVPVITDAILKGQVAEDQIEKLYNAMLKSAAQDIRGTNFYREYGYIPADKDGWSVTKTLEYAYDDWCIAQVAKKLNRQSDYDRFMKRAASYKPLFDKQTLFMRGKLSNGEWVAPFDPFYSEHGFEGMYIEGTAWQHSWFVPHDVQGLIELFGSEEAFVRHIDSTFNVSSQVTGANASMDISGLIGQYAHGNEPSHHIAYLYNYAGKPWKTQEKVRQIMAELYHTGPDALAGNDDCGQMSAWYIFSALGFYPVNPAEGIYVLGSPLVKNASLKLEEDKVFTIEAENNSAANPYIKAVLLNGKALEKSYLTHEQIMAGGTLKFVMDDEPNKEWATAYESYPPSMTSR